MSITCNETIELSQNANKMCRGFHTKLTINDDATAYQRQKIIQNVVRVRSSLYTMNLAGLNTYQQPSTTYQFVERSGLQYAIPPKLNWNQTSDRTAPSRQVKGRKVTNRPGGMSPGGVGVDVKHNSYERYLNKMKGKGLLKQGKKQESYQSQQEMTGGKSNRMAIVSGCDCENKKNQQNNYMNNLNAFNKVMYNINYKFAVGQTVLVQKDIHNKNWHKGKIVEIYDTTTFLINFGNDVIEILEPIDSNVYNIIPYFKREKNCETPLPTNFDDFLITTTICEKEQLLEAGILI